MTKAGKIVLTIASVVIVLIISAWLFVGALWTGAFNFMFPEEIATYRSPNGEYSLVFEQMGDPAWPFGPADVRLTLRNHTGKIIERVSAQVFNDGGSASKDNIASIAWNDDAVIIVLSACEMEDKEVSIAYTKKGDAP